MQIREANQNIKMANTLRTDKLLKSQKNIMGGKMFFGSIRSIEVCKDDDGTGMSFSNGRCFFR